MSDFWSKQRAKAQAANPVPAPPPSDVPWWAQGTNLVPKATQPENGVPEPSESRTDGKIDGHDISRADFLKGRAEECPNCPVNPASGIRGNMYKATSSSAWRCFDCGYVDGREIHDPTLPTAITIEGPAHQARQVGYAQGFHQNPYEQVAGPQQGVNS